jgi:hypothetical protein
VLGAVERVSEPGHAAVRSEAPHVDLVLLGDHPPRPPHHPLEIEEHHHHALALEEQLRREALQLDVLEERPEERDHPLPTAAAREPGHVGRAWPYSQSTSGDTRSRRAGTSPREKGYHRGLPRAMLEVPARLLAAADVRQALREPRPHRPAVAGDEAVRLLGEEVAAGRLDAEAVRAVLMAVALFATDHGLLGRASQR